MAKNRVLLRYDANQSVDHLLANIGIDFRIRFAAHVVFDILEELLDSAIADLEHG